MNKKVTKKPKLKLTAADGNAFVILGIRRIPPPNE